MSMQNKAPVWLALAAMTIASVPLYGQQQSAQGAGQTKGYTSPAPTAQHSASHADNEGQRIFEQNCSRCHATPDGFQPSISGTVVRHMRVRASLSEHDEKELLRFFNP